MMIVSDACTLSIINEASGIKNDASRSIIDDSEVVLQGILKGEVSLY
jgi:hypothetical protein